MSGLPEGWAETAGDTIFEHVRGVTYAKSETSLEMQPGFIGILRATNIQDGYLSKSDLVYVPRSNVSERQLLRLGDQVIASSSGSISVVGKAAPVTAAILGTSFGAFCSVARPRVPELADWLRAFFQSPNYRAFVSNAAMGNNINNLRSSDLNAIPIPLPPLPEQKRIVAKVDGLTARTARARADLDRIPTLIARYKQRLLALAFSGELTAGWRRENPAHVQAGRITVGELLTDIVGGKNLRCIERPPHEGEQGVVKVSAVTWGKFDALASKTLPESFKPPEKTRIRSGDLLISRANTLELVAAVVIVEETPSNLFLSDKILRLEMKDQDKPWLMWFLRSPDGRASIEARATGNQLSMRNLSQSGLRGIELPWPSYSERTEITRRIESAFNWLDRIAADHGYAAKLLPKLDAAILAKAFRGELVRQDPTDEPAVERLARIRGANDYSNAKAATKTNRKRTFKQTSMASPMIKSRNDHDVRGKPYLTSILKGRHAPVTPSELFALSGLPLHEFYHQLAQEYDSGWLREIDGKVGTA